MKYLILICLACLLSCNSVKDIVTTPEEDRILAELTSLFSIKSKVSFQKSTRMDTKEGKIKEFYINLSIPQLPTPDAIYINQQKLLSLSAYHFYTRHTNIKEYSYINVSLTEENNSNKTSVKYAVSDLAILDSCMINATKFMRGFQQLNIDTLYSAIDVQLQQQVTKADFQQAINDVEKKFGKPTDFKLVNFRQENTNEKAFVILFSMYLEKVSTKEQPDAIEMEVSAASKRITVVNF